MHEVGQLARLPVHSIGAHGGAPGLPLGEKVHVPSEPTTSHASQAAPQAVLQHTPSTHWLLEHWLAAVHAPPLARLGTQAVPLQNAAGVHWVSTVQAVGQLAAPPQRYGVQAGVPGAPAASAWQTPIEPVTLHASQAPPHAELQHTPSMHCPVWHWLPAVHATPLARLAMQVVPLQNAVAAHWVSVVQLDPHAPVVPPHTYGAHEGAPVAPAASARQVPRLPGRLQASQAPPHAVLQQYPSMHCPETHSFEPPHTAPFASLGTQLVLAQYEVLMHCMSEKHIVGQLGLPPQR